jgi:hypothetical protein
MLLRRALPAAHFDRNALERHPWYKRHLGLEVAAGATWTSGETQALGSKEKGAAIILLPGHIFLRIPRKVPLMPPSVPAVEA